MPIRCMFMALSIVVALSMYVQPVQAGPKAGTPYPDFRFRVKWADSSGNMTYVAGVSRVSGLSRGTQVVRHREGGDPSVMRLAPGQTEYAPIMLERGMSYDPGFAIWANRMMDPSSLHSTPGDNTSLSDFRKTLTIDVFNEAGQIVMAYNVFNAWVSEFSAFSELDGVGMTELVLESLTIENEGWERDPTVTPTGAPSFTLPKP